MVFPTYFSRAKVSGMGMISAIGLCGMLGCNSDNTATPNLACTPLTAHDTSVHPQVTQGREFKHIAPRARQYSDQGKVSEEMFLPVTVALSLNNEADLDERLAEMYQPGSPSFHRFMSAEEFRGRYAPTQSQLEEAKKFLVAHGIQVSGVSAGGYLIQAMGKVSAWNEAFQTEIHEYRKYNDAKGAAYFSPAIEPVLPDGLAIRAVHGLDNLMHFHSHAHASAPADAALPRAGSGPYGGMSPGDIHSAYDIPFALNGTGQTLALVELDGYRQSDVVSYEQAFAINPVPLQNIMVDGASGSPGSGAGEVTLDIELMTAVAPGASSILVYEAPNTAQALLDLYARIANDNKASVVSISWGGPEADQNTAFLETENYTFKQMASEGIAVFAASGDAGADDNGSSLSVDDPASQPFVVAVGGTQLNLTHGAYQAETTWNGGSPQAGAGGGGVSSAWPQPTWQNGVANGSNGASSSRRNVPDVSLDADPATGYAIYLNGGWQIYGGTSCAAPIWAAFIALVNEQRATNGNGALGFLNPYLYAIGKGANYSADFHDISDGSNNLYYQAVPGFDDATGWGSMKGQALIQDLSNDAKVNDPLSC